MEGITIFEALGEEKIKMLTHFFYKEVKDSSLLKAMYPNELEPAEERLFLFLQQSLGGPTTYSEQRGHPRLRMRHLRFAINEEARDEWLRCMDVAMQQSSIEEPYFTHLQSYFYRAAQHMINQAG